MIKVINPVKRDWLKELRQEKGLRTREIAALLGICFQHYSAIENGRRNPSVELSMKMARFFDISLEKFFQDRTRFQKEEQK